MRTILTSCFGAAGIVLVGVATVGCGSDDDQGVESGSSGPNVVVTTSILGDVVRQVVGDAAEIDVVMPLGADPHEFSASTQQAEAMVEADLLVTNGAGFEEGLEGVIDQAVDAGVPVFDFSEHVELLPFAENEAEEHAEEEAEGEEEHAEEEEHGHDDDPHLWTDPTRIAGAVDDLEGALADVDGIDAAGLQERADAYAAELEALDQEIESLLAGIPGDGRVLVTNHEVFGYFADRYGFEVVGTVIPSGTTLAEPSSADLDSLAQVIRDHGVPAIFAETSASDRLAQALADSVGDVEVVTLFTESLGEEGSGAETYVELMRTDAQRIAGALA